MKKEKVIKFLQVFFRQHKNQLITIGIASLLVGFFIGFEVRGYMIKKAVSDVMSGVFSNVSKTSESVSNSNAVKEMKVGDSFESDGLIYTLLDIQRADTLATLSDNTTRDNKIGFRIKVENKTKDDHSFNVANFQLKSRVNDNKITTVNFWGNDDKNFQPKIESNTLIDGAVADGWITYFLPKEISNDDLQFIFDNYSTKIKFRLQ